MNKRVGTAPSNRRKELWLLLQVEPIMWGMEAIFEVTTQWTNTLPRNLARKTTQHHLTGTLSHFSEMWSRDSPLADLWCRWAPGSVKQPQTDPTRDSLSFLLSPNMVSEAHTVFHVKGLCSVPGTAQAAWPFFKSLSLSGLWFPLTFVSYGSFISQQLDVSFFRSLPSHPKCKGV